MSDPISNWGSLQTPYSQEAEQATIGAVLVNSSTFVPIRKFLPPEAFFILRHRYIWEAFQRLDDRGEPLDYLTITEELRTAGKLAEIGGSAYLTECINTTPTSVHAEVYAKLVERAAIRRQVMAAADLIKAEGLDEEKVVEDVLTAAQAHLDAVKRPNERNRPKSMKDVMSALYDEFEYRLENNITQLGIPTGFIQFDDIIGGWRENRLIIVGGRPGMGKTALMLECGMRVANQINPKTGKPYKVLMVTMEMGAKELGERLLTNKARLTTQQILGGSFTPDQQTAMTAAIGDLSKSTLFIDDSLKSPTPDKIAQTCHDFISDHGGLDMLIVDYLQLMTANKPNKSREVEVSSMSRDMKGLAMDFHLPVMLGCQLNREVEKRRDKRAKLSDLRESGAIEQDADIVMFPYFHGYYLKPRMSQGDFEVNFAKHRNGGLGLARMESDWRYMDFVEPYTF